MNANIDQLNATSKAAFVTLRRARSAREAAMKKVNEREGWKRDLLRSGDTAAAERYEANVQAAKDALSAAGRELAEAEAAYRAAGDAIGAALGAPVIHAADQS